MTDTPSQNVGPSRGARALRRALGLWKLALPLALVAGAARYKMTRPQPAVGHKVDRGDVVREAFGRGTLESRREVQLGFDMVGRLSDVFADEGDRVKLGQLVAQLAPEQFAAEAKTATSGVALAQSAISRLAADEKRALADLDFAKAEEARIRKLVEMGAATGRDLELATQRLSLAEAELSRVRASQAEASRNVAVASGTAEARSVTVARAALLSPFDGLVIRRFRDPGDTVSVGTTVLRVVATDALWSRAWIDENALPELRDKQTVRVRLGAEGTRFTTGVVDRIGREVDRQTHELLVDVRLASPPERIAIGQRADVWIELERRKGVVRVPLAYVHRDRQETYCFVDRGGRVAKARVKIGLEGSEALEITDGLSAGDVVLASVSDGPALAEGRRWSGNVEGASP
jgi:HlyD family secretion protein